MAQLQKSNKDDPFVAEAVLWALVDDDVVVVQQEHKSVQEVVDEETGALAVDPLLGYLLLYRYCHCCYYCHHYLCCSVNCW